MIYTAAGGFWSVVIFYAGEHKRRSSVLKESEKFKKGQKKLQKRKTGGRGQRGVQESQVGAVKL